MCGIGKESGTVLVDDSEASHTSVHNGSLKVTIQKNGYKLHLYWYRKLPLLHKISLQTPTVAGGVNRRRALYSTYGGHVQRSNTSGGLSVTR